MWGIMEGLCVNVFQGCFTQLMDGVYDLRRRARGCGSGASASDFYQKCKAAKCRLVSQEVLCHSVCQPQQFTVCSSTYQGERRESFLLIFFPFFFSPLHTFSGALHISIFYQYGNGNNLKLQPAAQNSLTTENSTHLN